MQLDRRPQHGRDGFPRALTAVTRIGFSSRRVDDPRPFLYRLHVSTRRITTRDAEETLRFGQRMGERLADLPDGAVLILIGPLGAGKTVLAKGIALGLGVQEPVVSPTYTIVSQYPARNRLLHHVDLYRIEGRDQLENLGLDDILAGNGVVVVEWGEKLEPMLERRVHPHHDGPEG